MAETWNDGKHRGRWVTLHVGIGVTLLSVLHEDVSGTGVNHISIELGHTQAGRERTLDLHLCSCVWKCMEGSVDGPLFVNTGRWVEVDVDFLCASDHSMLSTVREDGADVHCRQWKTSGG
eukprot:174309-Amphidinium_carterae.1